jgi:hypothetical protein
MTNRYVDVTNGNDLNDGTFAQPWQTISKALTTALPGDQVNLRTGNYPERFTVTSSGGVGNEIVVQPYRYDAGSPDAVTINLASLGTKVDGVPAVTMNGVAYITFQGLTFMNFATNTVAGMDGIRITGSSFITFFDCLIQNYQDKSGSNATNGLSALHIGTGSHDITVNTCEFDTCLSGKTQNITVDGGSYNCTIIDNYIHDADSGAIEVAGASHDITIEHNTIEYVGKERVGGANYYGTAADCIRFNGATNCLCQRNQISNCNWAVVVAPDAGQVVTSGINARNNLIVSCNSAGIMFGNRASTDGSQVTNCEAYNNTIDGCAAGFYLRPTGGGGGFVTATIDHIEAVNSYSIQQGTYHGRDNVWRFEVRNGDVQTWDQGNIGPSGLPNQRAEISYAATASTQKYLSPYNVTDNIGNFQYRISLFYESGFPMVERWATQLQFHPDDSKLSNGWAYSGIQIHDNHLDFVKPFVADGPTSSDFYFVQPIQTGQWYDFVIDVNWSTGGGGWIKVYNAGTLVGTYTGRNHVAGVYYYLKQGYYRDGGITATGILYQTQLQIRDVSNSVGSTCVFKNNIVSNCTATVTLDAVTDAPGTWDSNNYYNSGGITPGSNIQTGNPNYLNPPISYALASNSPCINSGDVNAQSGDVGSIDFFGNVRLNGVIDRGCAEFGSGSGSGGTTYNPNSIGSLNKGQWYAIAAVEILAGTANPPVITSAKFNLSRLGYAPTIASIFYRWTIIGGNQYNTGLTINGSDYAPTATLLLSGQSLNLMNVTIDAQTANMILTYQVPYQALNLAALEGPSRIRVNNPDGSYVEQNVLNGGGQTHNATAGNFVTSAVITGGNFAQGAVASVATIAAPTFLLDVSISVNTGTSITIPSIPWDLLTLPSGENPIVRITNPDGSWADTTGATSTQTPPPPPSGGGGGVSSGQTVTSVVAGKPLTLIQPKPVSRIVHPSDQVVNRIQEAMIKSANTQWQQLSQMPTATKGVFSRESWSSATLLNAWAAVLPSSPGFLKTAAGDVHLRGQLRNDIANTQLAIMVLPVGYRPSDAVFRPCYISGTTDVGMINVGSDGIVSMVHTGGSTNSPIVISLGGIVFPAET